MQLVGKIHRSIQKMKCRRNTVHFVGSFSYKKYRDTFGEDS